MYRPTLIATALTAQILNAQASGSATLIHHYPFDTVGSVVDVAGSADGTLLGGASIVDGALCTDGVNDYVQFAEKIIPTSGSFTVALRFKTESISSSAYMELISQGCQECPGFYIGRAPNGQWRNWHDSFFNQTGVAYPATGAWHHVAVVYIAGSQSQLFVNGELVRAFPAATMTTQGSSTRLARQFQPFDEFHHGYIDDLRIYSGALTPGEVARLADTCPGDIDENSTVDGVDLAIVLSRWGANPKDYPRADTNDDGTVDGADLAQVLGTWGACP